MKRLKRLAFIVPGSSQLRIKLERHFISLDRFVVPAQIRENTALVAPDYCIFRIDLYDSVKGFYGLIEQTRCRFYFLPDPPY